MEIHAYNEVYVNNAMQTMAIMLDYAVNFRSKDLETFFNKFIKSPFAKNFEQGNPTIVAGLSGVELYGLICKEDLAKEEYVSFERTPEYWLGWSLAYYQWYSVRTFKEIIFSVSIKEMLSWYKTLHECDIMRFVEAIEEKIKKRPTNLEILRKRVGISQSQLSALSGVSIRSIQMYEQRQNDISKAQFNILDAISKVLGCNVYDLVDSNLDSY